jgi:hypothetical protein
MSVQSRLIEVICDRRRRPRHTSAAAIVVDHAVDTSPARQQGAAGATAGRRSKLLQGAAILK